MPVLPGPASSQVGIGIGTIRGEFWDNYFFYWFYTSFCDYTYGFSALFINNDSSLTWIQGLKLVAVAIVAQAIIGMGKN